MKERDGNQGTALRLEERAVPQLTRGKQVLTYVKEIPLKGFDLSTKS